MSADFCVAIASHISNPRRIDYLLECLASLTMQTIPVTIYLSISFETDQLYENLASRIGTLSFPVKPVIKIMNQKTPQMRHLSLLLEDIAVGGHQWILFCDDDDTYKPNRVETFINSTNKALMECQASSDSGMKLAGIYESTFGKIHQDHRHEYWCYCISLEIYSRFFEHLDRHPDVLDHKCCDIVFAEYFRRTGNNYVFGRITEPLYNYRVDNNSDSITGVIVTRQKNEIRRPNPPSEDDEPALIKYVDELNTYLRENLDVYLHDTYLRSVVGIDFDAILQKEFTADYPFLPYVEQIHIETIRSYWRRLRDICNEVYDIKF